MVEMKSRVKVLVEGGKASPGPPLGPALGPLGLNVGQVVAKINEKTDSFAGMKVPVTVVVDQKTKQFDVEVGAPPVSALIKKELKLERGAKTSGTEVVGNLGLAQAVSIAKMKSEGTLAKNLKAAVKEVLGTCVTMGVTVEGKGAQDVQREIDEGKHDEELK
jgi:large subunit ribosomal protein L11